MLCLVLGIIPYPHWHLLKWCPQPILHFVVSRLKWSLPFFQLQDLFKTRTLSALGSSEGILCPHNRIQVQRPYKVVSGSLPGYPHTHFFSLSVLHGRQNPVPHSFPGLSLEKVGRVSYISSCSRISPTCYLPSHILLNICPLVAQGLLPSKALMLRLLSPTHALLILSHC